ncbi:hypothetical protein GGI08_001616 [Coemansia sp. S2]|nr:hypothetical protein GGI08_001616 [Coemansia sp. S2]
MSRAEILAKQLELNAKRLDLADKQIDLANKQLELDEQQRELDDEQRELNGQSSVSVVFELMASASARTTAIPVVDAPTESISPCPPIAAMPRLLVAALPAARPTAAQEGKRPAPINELPESPIAPKRHRGKGQITNDDSTTGSSITTCRSLSEKVAVERLIAALDVPALVAPAIGVSAVDISAYFAPAAGATTFGNAPAVGVSAVDISDLITPAAGATTFGDAPAAGVLDRDFSALVAPATGATMFGIAPAAGTTTFGVAPAAGILDRDISAFVAPAAGATTFGVAPAAGVLDRDISALVAPAAGASTFGVAPAAGILDRDISALIAPAAGATTFGNAPAAGTLAGDISAFGAPATGASIFGVAPAAGILDCDISALVAPAAGATTFGNAPAIGVSAVDISAYFTPAAGATTFGIAPATGVLDHDISALVAPAAGASIFGVAPAAGILDRDFSALVAPAAGALAADYSAFAAPAAGALAAGISAFVPAAGALSADYSAFTPAAGALAADVSALVAPAAGASTFGNAPAVGVSAVDISALVAPAAGVPALVAPTVDVPAVDMRVSDSVAAAELLRMIYDVSGMVFDVSGEQVTSERLLVVLGEAPYVSLGYVLDAYRHIYGCALMPRTTSSQERIATLARVVAVEHWAPQLDEEDSEDIAGLNILCRRDLEIGTLRHSFREQLGLAANPNAVVLGPRLCYVVVRMCQMSVNLLTGLIIRSMFLGATGLDLHSLIVATEKGVQRMEANSVCQMVETWVGNIIKFIADDGNGLEDALSMATDCNASYVTRCSNGSSSNTSVAVDMLMNNVLYSTLFLGNGEAKWEALCRCLICFASKRISPRTKKCLYQLSTSLQTQPSSF